MGLYLEGGGRNLQWVGICGSILPTLAFVAPMQISFVLPQKTGGLYRPTRNLTVMLVVGGLRGREITFMKLTASNAAFTCGRVEHVNFLICHRLDFRGEGILKSIS